VASTSCTKTTPKRFHALTRIVLAQVKPRVAPNKGLALAILARLASSIESLGKMHFKNIVALGYALMLIGMLVAMRLQNARIMSRVRDGPKSTMHLSCFARMSPVLITMTKKRAVLLKGIAPRWNASMALH
jgi:hypothetical protein